MKYHPTTANFPGTPFLHAVSKASENTQWDFSHMQLCPQQLGVLSEKIVEDLQNEFLHTQFRLHANVRLFQDNFLFDASSDLKNDDNKKYIELLKQIHQKTNAQVYSYHAGYRVCSKEQMKNHALFLQEKLQSPVAIEGLYPEKKNLWLINSLDDYEWLANNIYFALDLSHLQIVYTQMQKTVDESWVIDMMQHPNCLEIHVSGNDGKHDNHQAIEGNEWWLPLIKKADIKAHVFTEENCKKNHSLFLFFHR